MKQKLLIVDDEWGSRQSLNAIFGGMYQVQLAENAHQALSFLNENRFDLVMLDYMMPDMDGVTLLKEIQSRYPEVPFVMVSASSTVRPVVDAMRAGAFDFVTKPYDVQEIRAVVARAIEHSGLKRKVELLQTELAANFPVHAIIGRSPQMSRVLEIVRRAAEVDATVLIHGESGTGKELIARQLHALSGRKDEPFVPVHCGSIPDTLMESELFGHEKGAFTGADRRKPGRFDMAASGSLFFDEVSEMSAATQVKLLRVLQEREYMRVGGTQVLKTNARIIAACNKDLMAEVREKRFREDLYYRLNVVPIVVPPLRDRPDDIPLLAMYFLQAFRQSMNSVVEDFAPESLGMLSAYQWPGNVRELRNIIERALVLHGNRRLLPPEALPAEFQTKRPVIMAPPKADAGEVNLQEVKSLSEAVSDFERKLVEQALHAAGGIQTRAAEILGTTRRILKYRMDKLNIRSDDPEERHPAKQDPLSTQKDDPVETASPPPPPAPVQRPKPPPDVPEASRLSEEQRPPEMRLLAEYASPPNGFYVTSFNPGE
ncbi:MAG TPA: sigma-54 dependent transcriptional regulator [Kiritimatiellia bacterium]|nr:sigma-54 dependent transcriptional regulator [Kiritimatiellia bacterium]